MIIVTGGTGFIGRRLIKELVKVYPASNILCLIRDKENPLETSGKKIIQDLHIKTKRIDLVSGKGLDKLPKNPELIFHLAANTETSDPDHSVNDKGTENLYNALKPGKNTHFIYVSTTAAMAGRTSCQKPFNESTPCVPTNEYSRTKYAAETFLREKATQDKFALTITRLPTVFGSGARNNSLFDFMQKLIEKKSLLARLDWPGLTGLIHANDVAKALVKLSKKSPANGKTEIYILYAESVTLAEISRQMHNALGVQYRPIHIPGLIWKTAAFCRRFVPLFEHLLSLSLYNMLWRASIVVDDVIHSNSKKAYKKLPQWKPVKLKDKITEVITQN